MHEWRVPTLDEAFALAEQRRPELIFLDTKLPPGEAAVARRMGAQYAEALRRHGELRERVVIACPDVALLAEMRAEVRRAPGFATYDRFAYDHEELSAFFVGHDAAEAAPLRGAEDNRFLSIGAPYKPLAAGDWDDLLALVAQTVAAIQGSERRLCVWTIDEEDQMRQLAALGPDYILTNRPALLRRIVGLGARVRVMCHRGGPDGCGSPENTLEMISQGLLEGEAVEIDVCSARDGAILHHDNDPTSPIARLRQSGAAVGQFRPVARTERRMDELTVAEIQAAYDYARDEKGVGAAVVSAGTFLGKVLE